VNFLLLGYGSIGKKHTAILRDMGHRVTTVDPDEGRDATFTEPPLLEVLESFDGVMDCTPPDVRIGWVIPAYHRFVEKPLGGSYARFRIMEPTMLGFTYRWHSRLESFVSEIQQHKIYSLLIVGGQHLQAWHKEDYRERDYWGVVLDSLPHSIYIARWILGELRLAGSVASKVSDLEIDVEDSAAALLEGPGGQTVILQGDYLRFPRSFYIEAQTSGGWYRWEFAVKEADAMYQRQMEQFVRVCQGDKASGYPNLEDGIAVQRILDAITQKSKMHILPEM
jgi:predicted dehydrogenase